MTDVRLREAVERLDAARSRDASAEELRPLMLAIAVELDRLSPVHAAEVRRSADTLLPMFGMRAERERRRWWRW